MLSWKKYWKMVAKFSFTNQVLYCMEPSSFCTSACMTTVFYNRDIFGTCRVRADFPIWSAQFGEVQLLFIHHLLLIFEMVTFIVKLYLISSFWEVVFSMLETCLTIIPWSNFQKHFIFYHGNVDIIDHLIILLSLDWMSA